MITSKEIRSILKRKMPRGEWVSLQRIYTIVEQDADLDTEDFEPQATDSNIPKWKRNVRNELQKLKNTPDMEWNRPAKYKLL